LRLEEELAQILTERGLTVAVAETTAGGLVSSRFVSVPGSSRYFLAGLVVYSHPSKTRLLGLPEEVIQRHGAVSPEAAAAMAEHIRRLAQADIGLAETGIAGPVRGRSPKPVGFVCIAISTADHTQVITRQYDGDRNAVREAIADGVLRALLEYLTVRRDPLESTA
jgi:nicotinamide-nucleotide amidase